MEPQPQKNKIRSSVLFFIIFGLIISASVAFTYYRIMIQRDYVISAEAACDPTIEKCFVYVCDPEAGEECTGNLEEDTSYYKIIKRKAFNIPLCDPNDETCDALVCPDGEADCSYELCEEGNGDGIECNDPEQYVIDNPSETVCEEGDETCLDEEDLSVEEAGCEEGDEECVMEENESSNAAADEVEETVSADSQ